jgi:hypothetical protein
MNWPSPYRLITVQDFLALPGVRRLTDEEGTVTLFVGPEWVEPYRRWFSKDGDGAERITINLKVNVERDDSDPDEPMFPRPRMDWDD